MALTPYMVIKGVVLRETETKEADKILTLLTAERGKLSVIARGARRKSCRYAACAQSLAYSEWTLYHKGGWYYANEGTTLALFDGLRADLDAMSLGFYFAGADRGCHHRGVCSGGVTAASAQRLVRPFCFTQAPCTGQSRV